MKVKNKLLISAISLLFSLSSVAWSDSFGQYFASNASGVDPAEPDTLYMTCSGNTIELRYFTDNTAPSDSIVAFYIPLVVTTDKPGVVLDTTVNTAFTGTALENWDAKTVNVCTLSCFGGCCGRDPSIFPMALLIGGNDAFDADRNGLVSGDYLIAKLAFTVSEPTTICIDTTSQFNIGAPLEVITDFAVGYTPQWEAGCCDIAGAIPTLTEWGLIIFAALILVGMIVIIRRKRLRAKTT
jgi:hypothetical protein